MPYGLSVSPTWQNNAGAMDLAVWNAPATAIAPSLGRAPSACGAKAAAACGSTIAIPLIQPGTQYEARRNQLDVRLSKTLLLTKKVRSQWNLDVFNLTNNAAIISLNSTFNSTAGSTTFQLPGNNGTDGYFLTTDGTGITSWSAIAASATVNLGTSASVTDPQRAGQTGVPLEIQGDMIVEIFLSGDLAIP